MDKPTTESTQPEYSCNKRKVDTSQTRNRDARPQKCRPAVTPSTGRGLRAPKTRRRHRPTKGTWRSCLCCRCFWKPNSRPNGVLPDLPMAPIGVMRRSVGHWALQVHLAPARRSGGPGSPIGTAHHEWRTNGWQHGPARRWWRTERRSLVTEPGRWRTKALKSSPWRLVPVRHNRLRRRWREV